ncbi:MAG: hypothetical protein H7Y31_07080 [Chitinophagaceae bacterium]|nr:hypothetical protein [Chitinophagaceae bacterium]
MKGNVLLIFLFVAINTSVHSQKLSIPDLVKIRSLSGTAVDSLLEKKGFNGEMKQEETRIVGRYNNKAAQKDPATNRIVNLIYTPDGFAEMQYAFYTKEEAAELRKWLTTNKYKLIPPMPSSVTERGKVDTYVKAGKSIFLETGSAPIDETGRVVYRVVINRKDF